MRVPAPEDVLFHGQEQRCAFISLITIRQLLYCPMPQTYGKVMFLRGSKNTTYFQLEHFMFGLHKFISMHLAMVGDLNGQIYFSQKMLK